MECTSGRWPGDLGYNVFLGRPKPLRDAQDATQHMAAEIWGSYSDAERLAVVALARVPLDGSPIPIEDFLPDAQMADILA